jgi:peptidoglycan/xylan/chitin deacetylase (PgdA/CDA1 family)
MQKWKLFICASFCVIGLIGILITDVQPLVTANSAAEIPAATKYLALTFDDGPKAGTTDRLLDGLKERGANATFFLVGECAAVNQGLVRRMRDEGHQVGNHTWSHVRLEGADPDVLLQEIQHNETLLQEILGGEHYWLRPPYGVIDSELEGLVTVPMIKWSVDPKDWESRNRETIVTTVLREVKPGSIILMHDIYPDSVDAALELVDRLQQEGYWFVTVEELFLLHGIEAENGVMYRTGA